ncbi:MAG: hypothetical protein WBE34_12015 [Candidatus Nitrosopolaris sp.]
MATEQNIVGWIWNGLSNPIVTGFIGVALDHFFISQITENRKSRKAGLLRNYDILKQNVLSYWEEERSESSTNIGLSYPESLIPLYVDILSGIRKRRYFNQLRCHLKDEK